MSSLSDFLGEIGRHQLLTPERELTMGRKVQEMVLLVNRCKRQVVKALLVNIPKLKEKRSKLVKRQKMR